MRKGDYLICYDISDNKRLAKIAKVVEANAMRIQRSVYLYENISKKELSILVDVLSELLDTKKDDLRIYTIKDRGIQLGDGIDLGSHLIFV